MIVKDECLFTSNRVNNAISNYVTDNRVNTIDDDPTVFQYLSKEVQLENPGTSIKIFVNAYLNTDCDIRAFYAISNSENFTPIYLPFPGFNNLNDRGEIINLSIMMEDLMLMKSSYC